MKIYVLFFSIPFYVRFQKFCLIFFIFNDCNVHHSIIFSLVFINYNIISRILQSIF